MTKREQELENVYVIDALKDFHSDWDRENMKYIGRLRHCAATVFEMDRWYILRSYDTTVALIDKSTGELFDFLRYVYGFTATSAQHIAKFASDYNAVKKYTYK